MSEASSIESSAPRVLAIAPSAYPLGGVAVWLDGLVEGLAGRGWRVEVGLLAGVHHDVDRYLEAHPRLRVVRRIANPSGSAEGRRRALSAAIRASAPGVVLSVNVADVEESIDRLRSQEATRARLVVTQHGLLSQFFDHLAARRDAVDRAVFTNRLSETLGTAFCGLAAERVGYAPYGVAIGAPAPRREASANRVRILWAGRLDQPQKRCHDLVAISAELERRGLDFHLVVAGDGPERDFLAAHLKGPRVELLGGVPAGRMPEVYARAEVLLVTSDWETGPIVAWEGLAHGLAVVSSQFLGSVREGALFDGATALLFERGDTRAAADALCRIADPALRGRLARAGLERVRERYTIERSVEAWDSELRSALARPARPAAGLRFPRPAAGRLDRWLGEQGAETARAVVGWTHRQAAPGDEWPHAYGRAGLPEFRALAERLEREPAPRLEAAAP